MIYLFLYFRYDQKLIIYDSSFTGDNSLAVINE